MAREKLWEEHVAYVRSVLATYFPRIPTAKFLGRSLIWDYPNWRVELHLDHMSGTVDSDRWSIVSWGRKRRATIVATNLRYEAAQKLAVTLIELWMEEQL
jgi:hypothetical protein